MSAPTVLEATAEMRAPQGRFFRPELDVLRFLAFSLVYLDHLGPDDPASPLSIVKGGVFGVPLFFALSAYLITELLFREKDATGTVHLRAFYTRRILRIWPLYLAALFAGFILSRLIPGTSPVSVKELAAYLLLSGNWYTVLHTYLPLGFGVLWSIGVEEQFYLLWPSFVRALSRKAVLIACAAVWVLSQIAVAVACFRSAPEHAVWCSTLSQMQYFAIGAAISILMRGRVPKFGVATRIALVLAGLSLFFLNHKLTEYAPYLFAGAGTVLVFLGFLGAPLTSKVGGLLYLGKISYGLYIFHLPVMLLLEYAALRLLRHHVLLPHEINLLAFIFGLPLTILISHLSYKYFEMPFLKLKERFEIVRSRPA